MSRENIDHPEHYNTGNIEVIDFIEDQNLGFHLGNVVKYVCRAGKKNPEKELEDLEKALWYLKRYIEKIGVSKTPSQLFDMVASSPEGGKAKPKNGADYWKDN